MNYLILLAILSDLITPMLIWKLGLPAEYRWLSHAALAVVLAYGFIFLLSRRRIPKIAWLFLFFSGIGILLGLLSGQGIAATVWGWYLMFKYPLVGFYAYLWLKWPNNFSIFLRIWCIRLLWVEVAIQVLQLLTGELPGDNLAGTLGPHGTAHLHMFVMWVVALSLGYWIVKKKARQLVIVAGLCLISSLLSEVKLFYFDFALLAILALLILIWRRLSMKKVLQYALIIGATVLMFPKAYDSFVTTRLGTPNFKNYFESRVFASYLNDVNLYATGYDVGRNYAFSYVWLRINSSALSLVFGEGLGARGVSATLGSAGVALTQGDLGMFTGTSLVVILGELGLAGLISIAGLMLWVLVKLWKAESKEEKKDLACIRYGLILYTALWPLWLWYTQAWVLPVPMLIYWVTLGYVLGELHRQKAHS